MSNAKKIGICIIVLLLVAYVGYYYGSNGEDSNSAGARQAAADLQRAKELNDDSIRRLSEAVTITNSALKRVESIEARNIRIEAIVGEIASRTNNSTVELRRSQSLIEEGVRILQGSSTQRKVP